MILLTLACYGKNTLLNMFSMKFVAVAGLAVIALQCNDMFDISLVSSYYYCQSLTFQIFSNMSRKIMFFTDDEPNKRKSSLDWAHRRFAQTFKPSVLFMAFMTSWHH